jgi:hypothetical protein
LKEEDRKDEVTKVNEEERSSEEEVLITSSLSCNIIIHLITSVFLPSPSSLLTLPNYLLRILFSSVVIIILLITKDDGEEGEIEV